MKNFDRLNFKIDLVAIDWAGKLNRYKDDANKAFLFFQWQINYLLDKYMPWKKLSKKDFKKKYKPWISDSILDKIKIKNKKFDKCVKCKDATRKEFLKRDYRLLQNETTELIRQSKKEYYNRYFNENKANMQKIWKGINEIINVKSMVVSSPSTIKVNGKTISDSKEIATSFNTYFTNIAEDIIRKRKYNGRKGKKGPTFTSINLDLSKATRDLVTKANGLIDGKFPGQADGNCYAFADLNCNTCIKLPGVEKSSSTSGTKRSWTKS